MKIEFAYAKSFSQIENRTVTWEGFAKACSKSIAYKSKEESAMRSGIIGGPLHDATKGREDNVRQRSVVTLDYDKFEIATSIVDVELQLSLALEGICFVAYSTFRHTDDAPRVRVMVPLASPLAAEAYPAAARALRDLVGLGEPDPCTYVVNQIMFLPSHREGVEPWRLIGEGDAWVPPVVEPGRIVSGSSVDTNSDELSELAIAVSSEPIDLTDAQVADLLDRYPAEGLDYEDWVRVGMALYHQTRGDGYKLWLDWSSQSSKHDPRQMRTKWRSFGGRDNPVTMASIIHAVGGVAEDSYDVGVESGDSKSGVGGAYEKLESAALQFNPEVDLLHYNKFKKAVQSLNVVRLPNDLRGRLASIVHENYGKHNHMTLSDIKASFKPPRVVVRDDDVVVGEPVTEEMIWSEDRPEWLRGWVYSETDNEFVHVGTGHAIGREAFRVRFDRMPECLSSETDAVSYASRINPLPTVAGRMYWPGQPPVFQYNSLDHLNSWIDGQGAEVAPVGSFSAGDGSNEAEACHLFREHLKFLIECPRERRLVLDWLSYVYANPGRRVNWALVLKGIEGNGKSYFQWLMQLLMGHDCRPVAAGSIGERFTGWAEGSRLAVIEEIRISGESKWQIMDRMKPFITNDTVEVERKRKDSKSVPNFTSYMMFTNHSDAIPISESDRRYFVVFTRQDTKEDLLEHLGGEAGISEYFDQLFEGSQAGIGGIARMLLDHRPSDDFDPRGRAPHSEGREQMTLWHQDSEDDDLVGALDDFRGPYINDTIIDLTLLQEHVAMSEHVLPQTRALSYRLSEMGYRKRRRIRIRGKLRTLWFRPNKVSAAGAEDLLRGDGVLPDSDDEDFVSDDDHGGVIIPF